MGSGISVQTQGKHIAYTAGTGVLVFMDLVAYLLIRVIEKNGGPSIIGSGYMNGGNSSVAIAKSDGSSIRRTGDESTSTLDNIDSLDLQNFSFELHTSFGTADDSIGLEMIELLANLCQKYNMSHLFTHHSRISDQNKGIKHTEETFKRQFEEYERSAERIKKVWVCGPPLMQEHFDRALYSMPDKKIDYHIL